MPSDAARRHPETPAWAHSLIDDVDGLRADVRRLVAATRREERIMADLTTAVADLTAAVSSSASELQTLADQIRQDGDVQAAADAIEAQAQALNDAVSAAQSPAPPPDTGGTPST